MDLDQGAKFTKMGLKSETPGRMNWGVILLVTCSSDRSPRISRLVGAGPRFVWLSVKLPSVPGQYLTMMIRVFLVHEIGLPPTYIPVAQFGLDWGVAYPSYLPGN